MRAKLEKLPASQARFRKVPGFFISGAMDVTIKIRTLQPRVPMLSTALGRSLPSIPPSQVKGYRTRGRRLQQIRGEHLRQRPFCVHCEAKGILSVATQLDHVVPLHQGGADTDDNRQGLCDACHKAKTARELKHAALNCRW